MKYHSVLFEKDDNLHLLGGPLSGIATVPEVAGVHIPLVSPSSPPRMPVLATWANSEFDRKNNPGPIL